MAESNLKRIDNISPECRSLDEKTCNSSNSCFWNPDESICDYTEGTIIKPAKNNSKKKPIKEGPVNVTSPLDFNISQEFNQLKPKGRPRPLPTRPKPLPTGTGTKEIETPFGNYFHSYSMISVMVMLAEVDGVVLSEKDWIGVFVEDQQSPIDDWVLCGAQEWDTDSCSGGICSIQVSGMDSFTSGTELYPQSNTKLAFKIYKWSVTEPSEVISSTMYWSKDGHILPANVLKDPVLLSSQQSPLPTWDFTFGAGNNIYGLTRVAFNSRKDKLPELTNIERKKGGKVKKGRRK